MTRKKLVQYLLTTYVQKVTVGLAQGWNPLQAKASMYGLCYAGKRKRRFVRRWMYESGGKPRTVGQTIRTIGT